MIFRTTQLFQKKYLSWCCSISKEYLIHFQNYFKPNHNSPMSVETLQLKLYQNLSTKTFFSILLAYLMDISKFQIMQILWEPQKFLKSQKSRTKGQNTLCSIFGGNLLFWDGPKFYFLSRVSFIFGQSFFMFFIRTFNFFFLSSKSICRSFELPMKDQ